MPKKKLDICGRAAHKVPISIISAWLSAKKIHDPTGQVARDIAERIDKEGQKIYTTK